MRLMTKEQRLAARRVPAGAHVVTADERRAAYCYQAGGKYVALCFRGSASKAELWTSYSKADNCYAAISSWLMDVDRSLTAKAERSAQKKAWQNPLTVGTILYSSWGYDQTNIDFYVVTRVSGRRVWVRELAQDSEATGWASGKCWPKMPLQMIGDETMHIAQPSGSRGVYVKISNCQHAWPEEGSAHSFSTYA